jgi:hypothetical protein
MPSLVRQNEASFLEWRYAGGEVAMGLFDKWRRLLGDRIGDDAAGASRPHEKHEVQNEERPDLENAIAVISARPRVLEALPSNFSRNYLKPSETAYYNSFGTWSVN